MGSVKRPDFPTSAEGIALRKALLILQNDNSYKTPTLYSADSANYPNHRMPFVDKHMLYIQAHPEIDHEQYLANLRLMSRER